MNNSSTERIAITTSNLISLEVIWNKFPFLKEIQRTRFGFNELHRMSGHSTYCVNNARATISYFQCKTCNIISCNHCGSEDTTPDNHQKCENHGRQVIDLTPTIEKPLEVNF